MVVLGVVGATLVPFASSSLTNITGFELDGNTVVNSAPPSQDWDSLFGANGVDAGGSALSKVWINDGTGSTDTGYGAGQTKDTADVSQWTWVTGGVSPPKDNIGYAYAANYVDSGNQILYFGQERAFDDKGGDANVGFWFLQDPNVGLNANGKFDGVHVDGDLLVQSEFTNGGAISGIRVYKWMNGDIVEVTGLTESVCAGGVLGLKDACAITNSAQITTPWSAPGSPYFFEGGINLTAVYGGSALPCFSSFLTNTRTSQAVKADLKDFAFGGLNTCGKITIVKDAQPNDGQGFSFTAGEGLAPATFTLTDNGDANAAKKVFDKLHPGSYTITETNIPAGWNLSGVSCETSGSGTSVSPVDNGAITVTLGLSGNVTCTYVNKRNPRLTVVKHVVNNNGGNASAANWTMNVAGPSASSFAGAESPGVTKDVGAGSYTVTETGGPASGYALSYSGDCNAQGQVSLVAGESKTCILTNDDVAPTLELIKHVVNDNGGTKQVSDFVLKVDTTQVTSGVAAAFNAGAHTASEVAVEGYTGSVWSGDCAADGSITLALGQNAVCEITNDDVGPTLELIKHVVNDNGGTKQVSDFVLKVDTTQVTSGVAAAFNAGAHTASEVAVEGYTGSVWSGDCAADGSITLALGQNAVCEITNDDVAGTIIVKKVVINDEGGIKTAGDFSFQVGNAAPVSFVQDSQDPLMGEKSVSVSAGTYTITEPAVAGYDASYENCSGIVVGSGETKTCTITNNDNILPTVDVQKTVRVAGSDGRIRRDGNGA